VGIIIHTSTDDLSGSSSMKDIKRQLPELTYFSVYNASCIFQHIFDKII